MDPTPFFDYARERQLILLRRRAGQSKPWTTDPRLRSYRFCNVFREDDVTTIWLRENVRDVIRARPELLLATVLFRWFNRMSTADSIFRQSLYDDKPKGCDGEQCEACQDDPGCNVPTVWDTVLTEIEQSNPHFVETLRRGIVKYQPKGPYVTGAYCIIGSGGMPKLDGVLDVFRMFCEETRSFETVHEAGIEQWGWCEVANHILAYPGKVTLESVWAWLRQYTRSGDFMAYEVVTDLAHSPGFLSEAPDRMSWANAGPGAIRGLNRLHGRELEKQCAKENSCGQMQELLEYSLNIEYWPQPDRRGGVTSAHMIGGFFEAPLWPRWDMRTVEHTLCEFDKYQRIGEGGKVKQVYRG